MMESLPKQCDNSILFMRKLFLILLMTLTIAVSVHAGVKIKTLARVAGTQDNPLIGYGLVTGLAGTGDSRRSRDTTQAIANVLQSFGININPNEVNSRNTATVMVSVNLPPFAHTGDKLDINVSSLGDARSLVGGTLLITPLKGPDNRIYALAQGPVSVGGFKYDMFGNVLQKNHPTAGIIPNGAIVEKTIYNAMLNKFGTMHLILHRPDFTTADRVELALNRQFGKGVANAKSAQDIEIKVPKNHLKKFIRFISLVESTEIIPDNVPMVVVNERTGVVVAGGDVRIDSVTISHGNLQISISTDYMVSQPTLVRNVSANVATTVVPQTQITAQEQQANVVTLPQGASVANLIKALSQVKTSTRDVISILESLKRSGALHAELVIQ